MIGTDARVVLTSPPMVRARHRDCQCASASPGTGRRSGLFGLPHRDETSMDAASIVGALATICSTTSFVPQAWKVIRTRDTSAISTGMYVVTVAGFSLWLGYGLLLGQWPLIVTNGVCLALSAFILVMKVLPRRQKEEVAETLDPTT
jgi:MtN3 and saliva related transmembrane protein